MTNIIKEKAPIILEEIKKAKSILLHCHPSPDPDSVGSTLAMKLALESIGKKVTLIRGDSEIPKAFQFPGVSAITQKSYGEIDPKEFDLFLILDSGSVQMVSRKTEVIFPESMMTIVIDHHASNTQYGKINCIDASYPATAQMIYDLLTEMGIKINHDIAINIFMGMYTDTGGFQYGAITSDTFRIASELAELAPDFSKTIFTLNNSHRRESLVFEGMALSSLQTFLDGRVGVASVTNEEIQKASLVEEDIYTGFISNKIKSVVGIEIAATFIEYEKGEIKISFRTRDAEKYDVSKIAVSLGGGGHKAAAGLRLNMSMKDAIDTVVKKIKELYNL